MITNTVLTVCDNAMNVSSWFTQKINLKIPDFSLTKYDFL